MCQQTLRTSKSTLHQRMIRRRRLATQLVKPGNAVNCWLQGRCNLVPRSHSVLHSGRSGYEIRGDAVFASVIKWRKYIAKWNGEAGKTVKPCSRSKDLHLNKTYNIQQNIQTSGAARFKPSASQTERPRTGKIRTTKKLCIPPTGYTQATHWQNK